nr:hypothetical protein [uncultured Rhodopila sp.]
MAASAEIGANAARFSVFSGRRRFMQTLDEIATRRRIQKDSHRVRANEDPA